jgi:hypothetical protein
MDEKSNKYIQLNCKKECVVALERLVKCVKNELSKKPEMDVVKACNQAHSKTMVCLQYCTDPNEANSSQQSRKKTYTNKVFTGKKSAQEELSIQSAMKSSSRRRYTTNTNNSDATQRTVSKSREDRTQVNDAPTSERSTNLTGIKKLKKSTLKTTPSPNQKPTPPNGSTHTEESTSLGVDSHGVITFEELLQLIRDTEGSDTESSQTGADRVHVKIPGGQI